MDIGQSWTRVHYARRDAANLGAEHVDDGHLDRGRTRDGRRERAAVAAPMLGGFHGVIHTTLELADGELVDGHGKVLAEVAVEGGGGP